MLHIITGRAKSGKSVYCEREFAASLGADLRGVSYFIVPEQFTMEGEKNIFALDLPTSGVIFRSEVLSFRRIVHRILGKLGGCSGETLPESGRAMLLISVLTQMNNEGKLQYYTGIWKKPAEVLTLLEFINELESYNSDRTLLIEKLSSVRDNADGTRKFKYDDLLSIYLRFSEVVDRSFLSGSRAWSTAVSLSDEYGFFKDSSIWIDEFTGFTDAEYEMISCMLRQGAEVTVALCTSRLGEPIFYPTDKTLDRLKDIALKARSGFKISDITEIYDFADKFKNRLLNRLELSYTGLKPASISEETVGDSEKNSIRLSASADTYEEVKNAAKQIKELISAGLSYSDIVVAVRNISDYSAFIGPVFSEMNIPFYIDDVKYITSNPAVVTINTLLDIYIYGMRQGDVIRLIKNGYYVDDPDRQDELENYILSRNIIYSARYSASDVTELKDLYDVYNDVKTVFTNAPDPGTAASLFTSLLKKLKIDETSQKFCERLKSEGDMKGADEFDRIWTVIADTLDIARDFLYSAPSEERFKDDGAPSGTELASLLKDYLNIGFSGYKMGFLPQEQNCVRVAGTGRSRMGSPEAMIILGVNEGVMPAAVSDAGILRETEREELEKAGIGLADSSLSRAYKEQFMIYTALFAAKKYLYISYALKNGFGEEMLPSSRVIKRLTAIMPWLEKTGALGTNPDTGIDGGEAFDNIDCDDAQTFSQPSFNVSGDLSKALLLRGNDPVMSISQIESYNRCPLSYLLERGLRLSERDVGEFRIADFGSIMHSVVEKGGMELSGTDLTKMNDDDVRTFAKGLADKYFYDTVTTFYPEFEKVYTPKNKLIVARLKEFCSIVLTAVGNQYKKSSFSTIAFECEFGKGGLLPPVTVKDVEGTGKTINISGRIDRLDAFSDGKRVYVSVVDYKSSSKKITERDIAEGLRIQLITYMKAATQNDAAKERIAGLAGKSGVDTVPGAGLYFVFGDGISVAPDRAAAAKKDGGDISDAFKMSGIVIGDGFDPDVLGGTGQGGVISIPRSGPLTTEKYDEYSALVDNVVVKTARSIGSGNFSPCPKPDSANTVSCGYCPFVSVCGASNIDKPSSV